VCVCACVCVCVYVCIFVFLCRSVIVRQSVLNPRDIRNGTRPKTQLAPRREIVLLIRFYLQGPIGGLRMRWATKTVRRLRATYLF
jgi:hypothetical protein